MIIVFILFSVLKQRFKVPEYEHHSFKLYIMMIFGFISNFLNFTKGFAPYFENYEEFSKEIRFNLKIDLSVLFFLTLIFFSVLFSVYSLYVLNLLRIRSNSPISHNYEGHWYNYRIVTLVYLCVFTLIYVVFLLHDKKIFLFCNDISYISENLTFVISMFPYFIHIINAVLMFSFYFELKYVNLVLSQNVEVDYLFEEGEKNLS